MNFEISKHEAYSLIKVNVEKLDSQFAPELKSIVVMLNKSGEVNMVVELSATKYCDSSGLSALLVANRLCRDAEGMLVICGLQDSVMKLISISQLHNVLHITPSVKEAEELITTDSFE